MKSLPNVDFSTIMSFTVDSVRGEKYMKRQTYEMLQNKRKTTATKTKQRRCKKKLLYNWLPLSFMILSLWLQCKP